MKRIDQPHIEITVVDVKGSGPREPGARMFWYPGGGTEATIGGGNLEQKSLEEAARLWGDPERTTAFLEYPLSSALGQCCGGMVRVFLVKQLPPAEALILGAGHVATALAHALAGTPLRVTIADAREAWAARGRFAEGIAVANEDPRAALDDQAAKAERTFLFIMTHDHPLDEELCRLALRHPFRWIGLIGSRTKWLRFRQRLAARGFRPEEIARIACPIGNPSLGKSPQEIAIGAAAQVLGIYHGGAAQAVAAAGGASEAAPGPRAALILAGGAGKRMGGVWKGGLELRGEPLVALHARTAAAAGAELWKAVYPAQAREEAERLIPAGSRAVNDDPALPMFASLQLGLRAIIRERPETASALVTPVDVPPLAEDLVAALWDRHESSGAWVTRPVLRGAAAGSAGETPGGAPSGAPRHGHPIIIDQRMFAPILAADPATERLDFLVRDLPAGFTAEFEIDAAEGLANLNTPEDWARMG